MLILGIETATHQVGCAIGGHEGVLALFESSRHRRHAETLVPAIDFVTKQARIGLDEIGVIAVDVGPGLYTGLRVGVATAKAMASALRVPMVGVPSLDLLALPLRHTNRTIVTVIDARRGELFYAFYRSVPGGVQRLTPHQVGKPGDLASELQAMGRDTLLVGDGARRYSAEFEDLRGVELAEQALAHPSAAPLVQLAHSYALREEFVNPWDLEPVYLRRPDAEINWETRDSR
ncbi:MAG TPA: tRNA (adenosine(37)-N6)-threonylcarbamoyltransferase complex dimerization subunit type 1 TsaB [Acidimicrobiales bacterium]|nr:tRNA (adenosine(37)-N6)-threonylcarbamoyltransferase complex dimerization subunit type 1 TsaB [Acidimicrobiales bacterium]